MESSLKKLGEVMNTQHHAHPLILCDSGATYGGWDEHEVEIVEGNQPVSLGSLKACIVAGGDHGHVDVFASGEGLVLVNDERRERGNPEELAGRAFDEVPILGTVEVPSGQLAIGIAYNKLNRDGGPTPDPVELLLVPVEAKTFEVRATEGSDGWRVALRAI